MWRHLLLNEGLSEFTPQNRSIKSIAIRFFGTKRIIWELKCPPDTPLGEECWDSLHHCVVHVHGRQTEAVCRLKNSYACWETVTIFVLGFVRCVFTFSDAFFDNFSSSHVKLETVKSFIKLECLHLGRKKKPREISVRGAARTSGIPDVSPATFTVTA